MPGVLFEEIFQSKQESTMSMYFLDDTDDWPEYTIIKKDLQRLESEHQALSKKLREAESALKFDVANEELKAKVDQLFQ